MMSRPQLQKMNKLVVPPTLQQWVVSWYPHYLQHPGSTRLEETLCIAMYWKGMHHTIQSYVKNCKKCQVNKQHKQKYGKIPAKLVLTNLWEALCVDLIGPYTLKGQDGSVYVSTMIDPATSWFKIIELTVTADPIIPMDTGGRKCTMTHNNTKEPYFDKSSAMISTLVNKTWFSWYPHCQQIIYDNGSEFKLHFKSLCDAYGIYADQCQEPTSKCNTGACASSNHGNALHC